MSTENRQLFGGPHDGTRVFTDAEGYLHYHHPDHDMPEGFVVAGFMQRLDWNVVPVDMVSRRNGWESDQWLVYGAFDGPHLYMEDSEGRLSHVPPAMNGALRMPDTLQ